MVEFSYGTVTKTLKEAAAAPAWVQTLKEAIADPAWVQSTSNNIIIICAIFLSFLVDNLVYIYGRRPQ